MMGFLLLFNSIFESDIMRVSKKMVDSDLQALLCQQLLIETKETRWVQTFRREMTKQLLHVELIEGVIPDI